MLAGVAVASLVLNTVIMSAINGAGELGRVVISNLIASVVGCAVYVSARVVWGFPGGLIGFAISQSACLPVRLVILRWPFRVSPEAFRGECDRTPAQRILGFLPSLRGP